MTERQQLPRPYDDEMARSGPEGVNVRHWDTAPTAGPPVLATDGDATILGFPADVPIDPAAAEETSAAAGAWRADLEPAEAADALVVVRRPDPSAGSLLLVAGTAAGMSLFLPSVQHEGALGLSLVQQGLDVAGTGVAEFARSGLVLPVGVALGGAVLFLAGLLAFRPARTHRATGVVALFVSLAVAAGVVVRVADSDWFAVLADPGTLCAVVVAGVGLLGALKAMLTAPEVTTGPR